MTVDRSTCAKWCTTGNQATKTGDHGNSFGCRVRTSRSKGRNERRWGSSAPKSDGHVRGSTRRVARDLTPRSTTNKSSNGRTRHEPGPNDSAGSSSEGSDGRTGTTRTPRSRRPRSRTASCSKAYLTSRRFSSTGVGAESRNQATRTSRRGRSRSYNTYGVASSKTCDGEYDFGRTRCSANGKGDSYFRSSRQFTCVNTYVTPSSSSKSSGRNRTVTAGSLAYCLYWVTSKRWVTRTDRGPSRRPNAEGNGVGARARASQTHLAGRSPTGRSTIMSVRFLDWAALSSD